MKTQKEIQKRIKELAKQMGDLKLSKELTKIEADYHKKRETYFKKIEPKLEALSKEIRRLFTIQEEAKKKKQIVISTRLQEWLADYMRGVDWGPQGLTIKEILDNKERFVLIVNPGHGYWSGVGMPQAYASTSYWIADTSVKDSAYTSNTQNKDSLRRGRVMGLEIEGRLTKENKAKLLTALEEYKKINKIH